MTIYIILAFLCLRIHAKEWLVNDLPNPKTESSLCNPRGPEGPSWICNPDELLTPQAVEKVNAELDALNQDEKTWMDCSGTKRGYEVAVFVIQRMKRSGMAAKFLKADPGDFCRGLHDRFGVGHADCNNGVTMLVAIDDREMYISTGVGAMSTLTNSAIQDIIEEMKPLLKEKEYDRAIIEGVHLVTKRLIHGVPWSERFAAGLSQFVVLLIGLTVGGVIVLNFCIIPLTKLWERWRKRRYQQDQAKIDKLRKELQENKRIEATMCPICLVDFAEDKKDAETLCCGHQFHQTCISAWLRTNNSCPVCRQERPRDPPEAHPPHEGKGKQGSETYTGRYRPLYVDDTLILFMDSRLNTRYHDVIRPRDQLLSHRMSNWIPSSSSSGGSSSGGWGGGSSFGGGGGGGSW